MEAVAIRHLLFEDLGLIGPVLEDRGCSADYLDVGVDRLDQRLVDADLLVVLGGPIGVGDVGSYPYLREEIDLIGRRIERGGPTLGVCLGAQLIASALGAEVGPTGRKEIGFGELDLTTEGERSVLAPLAGVPVLHWHGDEFQIPVGGTRLASTPGFQNQAFEVGASVLGLQFHIETDLRHIERWLIGHSNELAGAGIDPQTIRDDAAEYGESLDRAATSVLEAWIDHVMR